MPADIFTTPLWIDLAAIAVGSLQGAMFAAGFTRIDLFGISIIGIATGLGGGLLRDILLGVTPALLSTNWYLITATVAALVGMLLQRVFVKLDAVITILDALTIGLFGALGTTAALAQNVPIVPAVFVGVLTAVGGGFLRDLLLNMPIAIMHVGSLYGIAAFAGCSVLVGAEAFGAPTLVAVGASIVVTTMIRLLAVRFGWSLPEQRSLSGLRRARAKSFLHHHSAGAPVSDEVSDAILGGLATGAITVVDLDELMDGDHTRDEP